MPRTWRKSGWCQLLSPLAQDLERCQLTANHGRLWFNRSTCQWPGLLGCFKAPLQVLMLVRRDASTRPLGHINRQKRNARKQGRDHVLAFYLLALDRQVFIGVTEVPRWKPWSTHQIRIKLKWYRKENDRAKKYDSTDLKIIKFNLVNREILPIEWKL